MQRRKIPIILILCSLILFGCAQQRAYVPAALSLPTATQEFLPSPTRTSLPSTWTPSPVAAVACGELLTREAYSVNVACGATGIGEACFVAPGAEVNLRPGAAAPAFVSAGDRASLALVSRLNTRSYDWQSSTWGMALMRLQADGPGTVPGQVATAVLFGEAIVMDAGNGLTPFQSMLVHTGFASPECSDLPTPGVLLQSITGEYAGVTLNGLPVRFNGTLLVRAQGQGLMRISTLTGLLQTASFNGELLDAPAGTAIQTPLGGGDGFQAIGPVELGPLQTGEAALVPLAALPRAVAVGPSLRATYAPVPTVDLSSITLAPRRTATPTPTPYAPFPGQPPNGIQTYEGKRIANGQQVSGTVPEGGQDSWVFVPSGYGPASFDYFDVTALGDWDPVLTIESASWGVYEELYNLSNSEVEEYFGSLAGSGGDWRIVIRDYLGRGGAYTLTYRCQGPCVPPQ